MHDPRLDKLANVLTTHSTKIQPGEFVLIEGIDIPQEMVIAPYPSSSESGRDSLGGTQTEPHPP